MSIPSLSPRSRTWLRAALEDADTAQVLRNANHFAGAAFFWHQATEKLLKGLLIAVSMNPPRTHNLLQLHCELSRILNIQVDHTTEKLLNKVTVLYAASRYPAADEALTPKDWIASEEVESAFAAWTMVRRLASNMIQLRKRLAERKQRLLHETLLSLRRHIEGANVRNVDIVVFGSFASGEFDALSDVDLAVIAPTDEDIADAHDLAAHLLRWHPPHAQGVDVVVLSRSRLPRSGLAKTIAEGIPVLVGAHQVTRRAEDGFGRAM